MTTEPFISIQEGPPRVDSPPRAVPTPSPMSALVERAINDLRISRYRRDNELGRAKMWKQCWEYYCGDTWRVYPDWVPKVGGNFCETLVDTNTSVLTAMRPEFSSQALSTDGELVAEIIDDVMHYLWQKRGFLVPQQMAVNGQGIYGVSFIKSRWDLGIDDVVWDYVKPGDMYLDPLATSMEDCRWLIQVSLQPRREIEETYGQEIADDAQLPQPMTGSDTTRPGQAGTYVRMLEYWYRGGRKVARIAGHTLLEDGDNMIGMFPYARFTHKEVENLAYPPGIIESVKRTQKEYQEARSSVHAAARYYWSPKAWVSNQANIETMRSNQPGLCLVADRDECGWLTPPQIPPYLIMRPDNLRMEMEIQTGITEVSQGRRPANVPSAAGIEALTQSSHSRIQSRAPALEKAIARLGEITLRYIKLNYSDDRIMPFLDEEKRMKLAELLQPIDQFSPPPTLMELIRKTPVLITVQPGSTLNRSEGAMAAQAFQFFAAKAIDSEALLDATKWPNRRAILQRMMMKVPEQMGLAQGGQAGNVPGSQGAQPKGAGNVSGQPDLRNVPTEVLQKMARQMGGAK